jgi:ribonucleoside-diphosphate reductase alpha chain
MELTRKEHAPHGGGARPGPEPRAAAATDESAVPPHSAQDERGEAPMTTAAVSRRETLPSTRKSVTHKFAINSHEGYLTIGLFEDGRPGELFVKMSKEGSTLSGLIQGFCRAFSLALQHGLPAAEAAERFRGMRFEPMGATSNTDIPEATSILDYVARYILLHYGTRTDDGPAKITPG